MVGGARPASGAAAPRGHATADAGAKMRAVPSAAPPLLHRPRRRAPWWVASLAALAVAPVAGCGWLAGDPGPPVVLVGDSITHQSDDTAAEVLGGDWDVEVVAEPGVRTDEWVAPAVAAAGEGPTAAVVNLGTNDVFAGTPPATSMAAMGAILDAFAGTPCTWVVTVNEHMVSTRGDDLPGRARAYNDALRDLAAERDVGVIDWSAAVGEQLAAGEPGGSVTFDTVHPTDPFGEELLLGRYAAALDGCEVPTGT